MSGTRDRTGVLLTSTAYNGIDFVEVVNLRLLHVHFLNAVIVADPTLAAAITGGDSVPVVTLQAMVPTDWLTDADGRPMLALTALNDGDLSFYTLTLTAPKIDRFF